jgi:hypothetical protein
MPSDRYSRALYLWLRQEFPEAGATREQRFDHAERQQVMHRQWKSENYSSHYLGPKGVVPMCRCGRRGAVLRTRIAALFPQIAEGSDPDRAFHATRSGACDRSDGKDADEATPVLLHTLTATFNGSTAQYQQVANGEVVDHEEPAAMSASFSWEPDTGALGVFCEDREVRLDLATIFRDVVLACDGAISDMPMREFDLFGFSTPEMLKRLERDRVAGVEKISILQIKVRVPDVMWCGVCVRATHLAPRAERCQAAATGAVQRCGSNSSIRLAGCVGRRSSTSFR